jgi:hypothetical protein
MEGVHMRHSKLSTIVFIWIIVMLSSCGPPGQSSTDVSSITITDSTEDIQLKSKILPTVTFTPLPSETATLLPTGTSTPLPTDTPLPTLTRTVTRTPGPFSFFDDFTVNSGGWENCEKCSWENGGLLMGPFEPSSNFHKNYCTGCGERTFYKIAVDATFVEGQVDRFFGVFVGDAKGKQYYFGISPWQLYIVGRHIDENDSWEILDGQWSGVVKASYATNHFEVSIRPAIQRNTGDYIFSLNGSNVYIIYGIPVSPSRAGLAMDWHAVTSNYDNWEYLEIER